MNSCYSRLNRNEQVLLTHADSVDKVGERLRVGATSSNSIVAAIYNEQQRIYGVQFHPEVDLTPNGKQMLSNFLFDIAGLTPSFTIQSRKDECIKYVKEKVGANKVLVSLERQFNDTVAT
jgi:GMP synthase (glutamine-hydrolysing)